MPARRPRADPVLLPPHAGESHAPTEINRSDGVGSCEITQLARFHPIYKAVFPAKFLVPQRNQWHSHIPEGMELPVPTGPQRLRILGRSSLGAQVLEAANMVAMQLRIDEKYPVTMQMLQNYVDEKTALLGGERGPDVPRGINEMAATDKHFSDLLQQTISSLAGKPTTRLGAGVGGAGGGGLGGGGGGAGGSSLGASVAASRRASRPGSACCRGGGGAPTPLGRSRPSAGGPRVGGAMMGGSSAERPASAALPSRDRRGSGGSLGASAAGGSTRASRPASAVMPGGGGSRRPTSAARSSAGASSMGGRSAGSAASGISSAYTMHPSAAITYLTESKVALRPQGLQPHMRRTQTALVGMEGVDENVALFAPKGPRPVSEEMAAAARRAARQQAAAEASQAHPLGVSQAPSQPESSGPTLAWDDGTAASLAAAEAAAEAAAAEEEAALREKRRLVRVPFVTARSFCNFEKFVAAKRSLHKQSGFVTSVGPYESDYDRYRNAEAKAKDESLHPMAFRPGGLWEKFDPNQTGFNAMGYNIPETMPPSAHTFNHYYNTNMHDFRPVKPKVSLYM